MNVGLALNHRFTQQVFKATCQNPQIAYRNDTTPNNGPDREEVLKPLTATASASYPLSYTAVFFLFIFVAIVCAFVYSYFFRQTQELKLKHKRHSETRKLMDYLLNERTFKFAPIHTADGPN